MCTHYNNRGLFCDPHIIANNKERSFRKPAFANHNSSQTVKPLRYYNIRTCIIASPSQLPNLIQSQTFYDCNCFYIQFAINITFLLLLLLLLLILIQMKTISTQTEIESQPNPLTNSASTCWKRCSLPCSWPIFISATMIFLLYLLYCPHNITGKKNA